MADDIILDLPPDDPYAATFVAVASEAVEIGQLLAADIMQTMADSQNNSARSQQSESRVLGMSELGGCREFIRATVAGDVKTPEQGLKWAAFIGTALGDHMEGVLKAKDPRIITQFRLTLELKNGVRVSGSADAIYPPTMTEVRWCNSILDFKSKDGLATVRREGPTFKEQVQISGYVVAGVQGGTLADGATGHLIYIDRSGKDKTTHVWSVSYEQALVVLAVAEDRLASVAHALVTAQRATRDEPESWCWAIQCPFYKACWDGYMPTGEVDNPRLVKAAELYIEGRADKKAALDLMEAARQELRGDPTRDHEQNNGRLPDGTTIQFTLVASMRGDYEKLDIREPK